MVRKEKLSNGLTLITESMPHVRSVSLGVWLKKGSRHERAPLNGISHFLEHLVFKGTQTRSAQDIALIMDSVGGHMDAFTTKESTCFFAKVLDEHVPIAVDVLSDIVRNPRFDPVEMERERKVVLEEIRMVEDTPDELVYDLFSSRFYAHHPLGRPIQGTAKTLAAMSRARLLGYFRSAYRPEKMLIVAAGNLRHDRIARLIRKAFGPMKRGRRGRDKSRPPRVHPGVFKKAKRDLEQLHLIIGLPAFPKTLEDRYTLFALNTLLGGTMSSRLFQKIREQRGLAYSVYSAVHTFVDCGFLMVSVATSPAKGAEAVRVVLDELVDLREKGPDASELRVAKDHVKGSLMLSLESTSSRMSNLARQEIYFGRQFTFPDMLRRIEGVTEDRVRKLSRSVFRDCPVGLAAVGRVGRFKPATGALRL